MKIVNEKRSAFLKQGMSLISVIVAILCGGAAGTLLAVLILG